MKEVIVISGVNLVDLGPLSVYKDALQSLAQICGDRYQLIALVHRKDLFDVKGVEYLEFPHVKQSWLKRLRFEYSDSFKLSKRLKPALWIAMHDMTPRVQSIRQVVYCHNPAPFYQFSVREAYLDPKFGLFTLFYRFLYGIFLQRNTAVIVQQAWIRAAFQKQFGAKHVIVATPSIHVTPAAPSPKSSSVDQIYRFFYPALSRTFKNHELLLNAVKLLEDRGVTGFELLLTVDAGSNRCAADLFARYGGLQCVRWLGGVSRERVYQLYSDSDCLLFPSKLETWGLPLTEFKGAGKPILAVDLPYAHETIGDYDKVCFFDAEDADALANKMHALMTNTLPLEIVRAAPIAEPYAKDWASLWNMLLPSECS